MIQSLKITNIMKKGIIKLIGLLFITSLLLPSCMADLRTKLVKKEGITNEGTIKGVAILDRAWKKQGFDKIENHQVYSFHGSDTWRGMFGRIGKVWPNKKSELNFKFQVGTFDGQVSFLDGKRKGELAGLQNWNYYEVANNGDIKFKKENKRISFGLAAFQYFTEMVDRLRQAPIISYAGKKELRDKKYDLVFVTWHTDKPHKEADQYIAWINRETGIMDFVQYTIRENYLKAPGGKAVYGGVEFSDFRNIDGVLIAHEQTVYTFGLKKKKKNLHQLIISDFEFDSFDSEELRLDKNIDRGGNFKSKKIVL
jgi:hypothetical protein